MPRMSITHEKRSGPYWSVAAGARRLRGLMWSSASSVLGFCYICFVVYFYYK